MSYILRHWLFLVISVAVMVSCQQTGEKKPVEQTTGEEPEKTDLDQLTERVKADSLNPETYYLRAKLYLDYKDVNRALADINKAIQLDDDNSDYFVTLADIYLATGRIPNCMDALKKAEELSPSNNNALLKLAEVYLILQDYSNTFAYTKKALDNDLINPVAHFIRGYAYMELGDTTLAIKNLEVAADQDQSYYEAYIELGLLYSSQASPLATGYLQTATRIEPNRPEGYYLLGMSYQEQENIPKAIETYEKLITISPDYKEAHYNLGYVNLVYINDFPKAVNYFTKAISLDPAYTDAIFNRGYSYELMGDYANARKDYLMALELVPNYERSVTGLNRLDSLEQAP
jgi:tetratricopeptide (TPR) repeat protein